jgi:hypothetical protein
MIATCVTRAIAIQRDGSGKLLASPVSAGLTANRCTSRQKAGMRILQREIDHLQETLYIGRMRSRSFSSLDNYNRHWKTRSSDDLVREFNAFEPTNS